LRRLPFRARSVIGRRFEPDGEAIGTVGLLAGCVMDPWFGPVHRSIVQTLTAAGCRVVVPERQTCCGALAAHEGEAAAAERYLEKNRRAFSGVDLVVADAAGCSAHLREADIGVPVEDAVVSVAGLIEEGVLPRLPESGDRVAVQDPCHHRHAQRIVAQPRAILRAAGLTPVEIDIEGMCCGAAGLYSMAHPETSAELGRRKAEQIKAAEVSVVASANPGCEMQLRAFLGSGIRVAHPVELYAERALGIRG
jgi:glycolate oxidase iron-sulfur subunit